MLVHVNSLATVTSRVSTVLLLSAGSLVVYLHSIQSLKCLKSCGYSASTRCCQIRQSPGAPVRYRATPDQGLFINNFAHYLDKTLRRTTLYCTSNRVVATVVCPWHCRVRCSVVGFFLFERFQNNSRAESSSSSHTAKRWTWPGTARARVTAGKPVPSNSSSIG